MCTGCLVTTDLGLPRTKASGLRAHWERKGMAGQMWPTIPPCKARLGILRNLDVRALLFPYVLHSYQPNAFLMADTKKIHA